MKTYSILYVENVPVYGLHEIEAENDQAAIEAAIALYKNGDVVLDDICWEGSTCARIVHIESPSGTIIEENRALDDYFLRDGGDDAEKEKPAG